MDSPREKSDGLKVDCDGVDDSKLVSSHRIRYKLRARVRIEAQSPTAIRVDIITSAGGLIDFGGVFEGASSSSLSRQL